MPIIWAIGGLAALFGVYEVAGAAGNAAEKAATLTKWTVIGGGIYLTYKIAKSGKLIK